MAIKKMLLSLLGEKKYLAVVAGAFPYICRAGLLGRSYQDIYFLKKLIPKGAWCVDIGAHLGYYTLELSRLAGPSGKVIAIEPVSRFNRTLQQLLKRRRIGNVSLYQVALGGNEDWVEIGVPRIGKDKKFAYARIVESSPWLQFGDTERVKNERGDHLFLGLSRLDFIKCDVEGLEVQVFGSMMGTLAAHRPILLCELADKKDRIRLFGMLQPLGYQLYYLHDGKSLIGLDPEAGVQAISHNYYFLPQKHRDRLGSLLIDDPGPPAANPASDGRG